MEQCDWYCDYCEAVLIDDAWKTVNFLEDGSVILNRFAAYVCSNKCGFYVRIG